MAYKINGECLSCGACQAECKNQAIKEGDTLYLIDPNTCTECVGWLDSPKCVEVCPVDAIAADPEHKESRDQLLEKWKKLHPGEQPSVS